MKEIREQLFQLQDKDYKAFHGKLIPNISPERIIGVRTPALRSFAKELLREAKKDDAVQKQIDAFLSELPHQYYDENNLHAFSSFDLSGRMYMESRFSLITLIILII